MLLYIEFRWKTSSKQHIFIHRMSSKLVCTIQTENTFVCLRNWNKCELKKVVLTGASYTSIKVREVMDTQIENNSVWRTVPATQRNCQSILPGNLFKTPLNGTGGDLEKKRLEIAKAKALSEDACKDCLLSHIEQSGLSCYVHSPGFRIGFHHNGTI